MKLQKLIFFATFCIVAMSPDIALSQKLPLDPAVTTGKLPNGFTYYVRKNSKSKKRAMLYLVNKVGSILENDDQRGLAHFMEHMSFNGSKHFPDATLVDFLEKAGVRFGADLNAYTSFDETVYQLPIPIDDPKMLDDGLEIIRDWASEATLDQNKIDKERGIVLEEKRLQTGSQQRLYEQSFPYRVNHSRYADRNPIGTEEILKNFKRETILSFYKDWYRPDLQAIIVVGDIDVKSVVAHIHKLFSAIKNPESAKVRPEYAIELTGKNQFLALTDKEAQGTVMQITIKYPHKALLTGADYHDFIKRNLFNQLIANRFRSVSQKNSGKYLSARAGLSPLMANIDAFNATISAKPGELEMAFAAFWTEIYKIKSFGFTPIELENAKSQYLNNIKAARSEEDNRESSEYADEYVRHFLQGTASPGISEEARITETFLPTVSLKDLFSMAAEYIGNKNRDIIITAPETEKAKLPDEAQVKGWFAKSESVDFKPVGFDGAKESAVLKSMPIIAVPPVNGKIVSSAKVSALNLTELRLSNGVRVVLKPTTFKNDEVSFTAFSPGGTSLYSDRDYRSAVNAASLISAGGVGDFNAEKLREKLIGIQASVSPYIGERLEEMSGYSNVKDLEVAFQLSYLYFTRPRKDTAEFNASIGKSRAAISGRVNSPERMFNDTINAIATNYSKRYKSFGLAELEQINLDRAFEIYKDRFRDASDFTFIVVGNFDPVKIRPLIERYWASLPSISRKETAKDLRVEIPKGIIKKTIYGGLEDKANVELLISGDYLYTDQNDFELEAIKHILELRMLARLREKEGGVYSPRVSLRLTHLPKSRYSIGIGFGCSPSNVDKLIAAVWEEIEKIKVNGPAKADLDKYIVETKVGMEGAVEDNGFWLGYLKSQLSEGHDIKEVLSYRTKLDNLSTEKLKKAINSYLTGKNYLQVVLMPQSKKNN
jgi:zinc protease